MFMINSQVISENDHKKIKEKQRKPSRRVCEVAISQKSHTKNTKSNKKNKVEKQKRHAWKVVIHVR